MYIEPVSAIALNLFSL